MYWDFRNQAKGNFAFCRQFTDLYTKQHQAGL